MTSSVIPEDDEPVATGGLQNQRNYKGLNDGCRAPKLLTAQSVRNLITVSWSFRWTLMHQNFPDRTINVHELSAVGQDQFVLVLTRFVNDLFFGNTKRFILIVSGVARDPVGRLLFLLFTGGKPFHL